VAPACTCCDIPVVLLLKLSSLVRLYSEHASFDHYVCPSSINQNQITLPNQQQTTNYISVLQTNNEHQITTAEQVLNWLQSCSHGFLIPSCGIILVCLPLLTYSPDRLHLPVSVLMHLSLIRAPEPQLQINQPINHQREHV
jgi:hypothetical protein